MTALDRPTAEAWILDTLRREPVSTAELTRRAREHFGQGLTEPANTDFLVTLYGVLADLAIRRVTEGVPSGQTYTGEDGKQKIVPGVLRIRDRFALDVVDPLRKIADREIAAGATVFMKWPDRWYESLLRRCGNGHVSKTVLKSEALGRDACLACGGEVHLTFPEDKDGPLVATT